MGLRLAFEEGSNRERRIERVLEASGESAKSKAIDVALQHYLNDLRNKERVIEELDREVVEELSTPQLPLEKEISTSVGPEN